MSQDMAPAFVKGGKKPKKMAAAPAVPVAKVKPVKGMSAKPAAAEGGVTGGFMKSLGMKGKH